jgi:hypothetical protein
MATSDVPDWSANLARLRNLIATARSAGNHGEPAEAQVRRFLDRLSRSVGRHFPPAIQDRLQPEAIESVLLEKLPSFREAEGQFEAWCWVVLCNYARDLRRRSRDALDDPRTIRVEQGAEFESASARESDWDAAGSALDVLLADLRSVRRALDEVASRSSPAQRVDYHAVLLVKLRWVLFERLRRCFPVPDLATFGTKTWSGLIEVCLPWHAGESDRRFKPGWPSLEEIWREVSLVIEQVESLSFERFQSILGSLSQDTTSLTPDLWHHWVKRAKDAARGTIDPCDWDRLFGRWLPDKPLPPEEKAN